MLLYGNSPLVLGGTSYITLQDANVLLNLLSVGPVFVASDTGLPVRASNLRCFMPVLARDCLPLTVLAKSCTHKPSTVPTDSAPARH